MDQPGDGPPNEANGDLFETLWSRIVDAWDDDKPHQAILALAVDTQRLPDLAARYRAIKEHDPARAERAQKKLDGIVIAATQMLMAMKSPPRTKTPWQWTASVAIVAAIVFAFLYMQLFRHR